MCCACTPVQTSKMKCFDCKRTKPNDAFSKAQRKESEPVGFVCWLDAV